MWWPYSSPSVATSVNVACPSGSASPPDGRSALLRRTVATSAVAIGSKLTAAESVAVVEGDHDVPLGAERDAVQATCVEPARRRLPRREDRVADAGLGGDAQREQVDGRLRQPEAERSMAEAQLGVTQAPDDLRPPVASAGQRQDGVVERLGHGAVAARPARRWRRASRGARDAASGRASGRGRSRCGRSCRPPRSVRSTRPRCGRSSPDTGPRRPRAGSGR